MASKQKIFSVDIDRNCSQEIIIPAKNAREAKKKAWEKFTRRKPKRKEHQIYVDEIYGRSD